MNGYLKELFQLNNVRYRSGKHAKIQFELITLVYNVSKLAGDLNNLLINHQQTA